MRLLPTAAVVFLLALAIAGCGDDDSAGAGSSAATGATGSTAVGDTRDCPPSKKQPTFPVNDIIGVELVAAQTVAGDNGYQLRTIWIDGEPQAATMDYLDNRLNVAVRAGIVTQLCSIG